MKSYFKAQLLAITLISLGLNLYGKIETINNKDEFNALVKNNKNVFVKISAEWCGACKMVKEPFIALSDEAEFSHVKFAHADLDQNRALAQEHGVVGIPTFLIVSNGQVVDKATGVKGSDVHEYFRNIIRSKFSGAAAAAAVEAEGSVTTEETTVNPATGTETTTKEVTTEQVQGNQAVVTQEETNTQEAEDAAMGLLDKLKAFFLWILNAVRSMIEGVFNWIKSLFGK